MSEWNHDSLPDFTVYGFHTGKTLRFKTSDGAIHEDIYQGWGVFGKGAGRQDVDAWQPMPYLPKL